MSQKGEVVVLKIYTVRRWVWTRPGCKVQRLADIHTQAKDHADAIQRGVFSIKACGYVFCVEPRVDVWATLVFYALVVSGCACVLVLALFSAGWLRVRRVGELLKALCLR